MGIASWIAQDNPILDGSIEYNIRSYISIRHYNREKHTEELRRFKLYKSIDNPSTKYYNKIGSNSHYG